MIANDFRSRYSLVTKIFLSMFSVMPLQDEERLFIEAIRDLNYQASRLQAEENETTEALAKKKRLEQESSLLKGEKGDGGDADAIHRSIAEAALKAKNAFDKMPCSSPAGLSQNLSWMQENLQKIQSSNMQFNNNVSSSDEEENVPKKMKLEV